MSLRRFIRKLHREYVAGLSKVYVPYASTTYLGLKLKIPLIYGMRNGGYIVPAESWMSDCLRAFTETKEGCIIDVGVNVGLYLVKLRAISPDVKYYGFEPNPACTFYTQELIRRNRFKNAKVFTVALGESPGIQTFYASRRNDGTGSLMKEHQAHNTMEFSFDTMVQTGDAFVDMLHLKEDISAIKIDVERAELYVLRGLENTIRSYKPYIFLEILYTTTQEQKDRATEISKFFQDLNYAVLGINWDTNRLDLIEDITKVEKKYRQEFIYAPNDLLDPFLSAIGNNQSGIALGRINR